VQPDVLVVCDASKLDRRGVRGAPDFVVEVLSPGTAAHDQVRKRRVYERAGVKEYWLIHPVDRIVTIYRWLNGEYGKPDVQELVGETRLGILPEIVIAWDELAGRLFDQE
jgi:Uma2 family endonuclease